MEKVSNCCLEPVKVNPDGEMRCTYCFEPCIEQEKRCPECQGNGGYWTEERAGVDNEILGGDWKDCPACFPKKPE